MATFAMFVRPQDKAPRVRVLPVPEYAPACVLEIDGRDGEYRLHCRSIDDVYAIYQQLSNALAAHEDAAKLSPDDEYVLATPTPVSGVDGATADAAPFPNEVK